jgi:aconitate hydratase
MGILPLQFMAGENAKSLGLTGTETFDMIGLTSVAPGQKLEIKVHAENQPTKTFTALVRIDTPNELEYFRHGGILPYVLRQVLTK